VADNHCMAFSDLVANPGRLRILMALATTESQEFVQLRSSTRLTDGNLSAHAKRLSNAGLIGIDKAFRDGKPLRDSTLRTLDAERWKNMLTPCSRLSAQSWHIRRHRLGPWPKPTSPIGSIELPLPLF